jgi:hypothetical protein
MKKLVLLTLMGLLALVAMPIFAQSLPEPIAPDAPLTEVFSFDNVEVFYPAGLVANTLEGVVLLQFSTATDFIRVYPHTTLVALDYDFTDLLTVAGQVYADTTGILEDAPLAEDTLIETTVGMGYSAYMFDVEVGEINMAGYVFDVYGEYYAITLSSLSMSATPYADQRALLSHILDGLYIDGFAIGEGDTEPYDVSETVAFITENLQDRPLPPTDDTTEMEQVVTGADGNFIFTAPSAWVVNIESGIYLSVSQAVLDRFSDITAEYAPDEVTIQVAEKADLLNMELAEFNALSVFAALYNQFANEGDVFLYEPQDNGYTIYYTPLTLDSVPVGAFVMVAQVGDNADDLVAIIGVAGDFATIEPTLIAIINSMGFVEAVEEE